MRAGALFQEFVWLVVPLGQVSPHLSPWFTPVTRPPENLAAVFGLRMLAGTGSADRNFGSAVRGTGSAGRGFGRGSAERRVRRLGG